MKWPRPPHRKSTQSGQAGRVTTKDQNENTNEAKEKELKELKEKTEKNRMCRKAIFRNEKSIFALLLIPPMDLLTPTIYFQKAIIIQKARFSH